MAVRMDDRPRRWVLRRNLRWRDAIVAIPMGIVGWGAYLSLMPWQLPFNLKMALSPIGWLYPLAVLLYWPRGRLTADRDGVTWHYRRERGALAWDDLERLSMGEDGLTLAGAGRQLVLEPAIRGLSVLASELQAYWSASQAMPLPRDVLNPASIAQWLGIEPGESLIVNPPALVAVKPVAVALVAALILVAATILVQPQDPYTPTPWALALYGLLLALPKLLGIAPGKTHAVHRANIDGLYVYVGLRKTRLVPWSSVWAKRTTWWRTLIDTDAGTIVLDTNREAGRRIVEVVDHLLAARAAGRPLPRLSDVPEAALSRARVAVEVERGISRVREGDG